MKVYNLVDNAEKNTDYKPVKTFQDVFNHIVNHLMVQNKSAAVDGGNCRYRIYSEDWSEARKCAVGCLISENNYHEIIEDSLANNSQVIELIKKSNPELIIDDKITELFLLMQFVHDHLEPENWIYMCYLLYRDMNRLIAIHVNKDYENIEFFPYINDYDNQKELYKHIAKKMTKSDIERINKHVGAKIIRDMYLIESKSDESFSPMNFFSRYKLTLESLIRDIK